MQELRSTDILDKEIEADARRRAETILKRADEDCLKIAASVQTRIDEARLEKEEFYSKKLAAIEKDHAASEPLEKQRFRVSFIQQEIMAAINKYLAKLSEEERLALVTRSFDFSVCRNKKVDAFFYGFNEEAVEKILKEKIGSSLTSCTKTEFGKRIREDEIGLSLYEGIILEAQDNSFRCRLTLVQIFSLVLDKWRAELSKALFGGNI